MSPVAEADKKTVNGVMPIGSIKVKENVRKFFDKKGMDELAENIKKVGVLQPLIVRIVDGHAELIAGERRLRAAKAAGLTDVPVRVIDVDDQAALEIQAFENLHRKDLGPIEEARMFKILLDTGKHDVKTLAERVDKSESYVTRAVRLLELPAKMLDLIESGKLTPAHGHQVLRAPDGERERVFKLAMQRAYGGDLLTAAGLKEAVDREYACKLETAKFPKDKPFAGEMACAVCPFNSGNQGQLFDGAQKGRCTNPPCFQKKNDAMLDVMRQETAGKMKGLQDFGIRNVEYSGAITGMKDARTLPDYIEERKDVKALIKEHPEKFGFVISRPRYSGDDPQVKIVVKDLNTLPKAMRQQEGSSGRPQESARDRFMKQETANQVIDAVAAKLSKIGRAQWLAIIDGLHGSESPRRIYGRLGIESKRTSDAPDLSKITSEAELARTALLLALFPWGVDFYNTPLRMKHIGLRMADILKVARAKASKAWAEKKAAKKG